MSGAMGKVGQMAEYTPKKTIQSAMLPHTARWENYNTQIETEQRSREIDKKEIKRQKKKRHEVK